MNFFDNLDSGISKVITGISNALHPSLSWQTSGGSYPNYPVVTNDEFLYDYNKQKNQNGVVLIGVAVFLLLILKSKKK